MPICDPCSGLEQRMEAQKKYNMVNKVCKMIDQALDADAIDQERSKIIKVAQGVFTPAEVMWFIAKIRVDRDLPKMIKKSLEAGRIKQDKPEIIKVAREFYKPQEVEDKIEGIKYFLRDILASRIEAKKSSKIHPTIRKLEEAVKKSVDSGTFEQDLPDMVKLYKESKSESEVKAYEQNMPKHLKLYKEQNPVSDHEIKSNIERLKSSYEKEKKYLESHKVNYSNQTPVKWVMDNLSPESGVVFVSAKECSNETIMGTEIGEFVTEQNKDNSSIPKDKTFLLITDRLQIDIALTPLIERIQARDSILFFKGFVPPVEDEFEADPFIDYKMALEMAILKCKAKAVLIDNLSIFSASKREWKRKESRYILKSLQKIARELKVVIKIVVKELSDESMVNFLYLDLKNGSQLQRELREAGHARSEGIVKFHIKNLYGPRRGVLLQKHVNINAHGYEVCWFEKVRNLTLHEIENIDDLCKRTQKRIERLEDQVIECIKKKGGRATQKDIRNLIKGVNPESLRKACYRAVKSTILKKQGNEYTINYH